MRNGRGQCLEPGSPGPVVPWTPTPSVCSNVVGGTPPVCLNTPSNGSGWLCGVNYPSPPTGSGGCYGPTASSATSFQAWALGDACSFCSATSLAAGETCDAAGKVWTCYGACVGGVEARARRTTHGALMDR